MTVYLNFKYALFAFPIIFVWAAFYDESSLYVSALGFLFIYKLISFIDRIGKEVLILDLLGLLAVMQWLFFPALYYLVETHKLVEWRWWYLTMKVPMSEYFSLSIPSTLALLFGIHAFEKKYTMNVDVLKKSVLNLKNQNGKVGVTLVAISMISFFLQKAFTSSLDFLFTLLNSLFYLGIIYIYFSNLAYRIPLLLSAIIWTTYSAVNSGMFGMAIWWPLMISLIILLGKRISLSLKLSMLFVFTVALSVIQTVKGSYRAVTWKNAGRQTEKNTVIFQNLIEERVNNASFSLMNMEFYYPMIGRMNQGYHVTMAQRHTPAVEPFCYGETFGIAVLSAIVPRILWHDKPEAGGRINYERFTGYKLESVSMNIGQLGDAYVNFTKLGAPIILFLYGLFLSYLYYICILKIKVNPTFLFWIPVLFIHSLSVETDFLTTINGAVKSVIFGFIVFSLMNRYFYKTPNRKWKTLQVKRI